MMLWEDGGSVLAWGWAHLPDELDFMVHPEHPQLADEVLGWFEEVAHGELLSTTVLGMESHLIRALVKHGYKASAEAPFFAHMARNLDDLPEPELPDGFVARPVRGEDDLVRRADVHRAAWELLPFSQGDHQAQSRVTADSYRDVMSAWPYRPELDWVVEAPNGEVIASCCIWYDERNRVGEIEPVGTHPDFRHRGLARAVCLYALRALRQFGATEAIVYPRGDEDYPIPARLYRRMGFSTYASTYTYVRKQRNNTSQ